MNEELKKFQLEKKSIEKQVLIGGAISLLSLVIFVATMNYGPYGLILLIPGLVYMIMGTSKFSKLSKKFKNEVLREVISGFVEDGVFDPDRGLDMNTVYNTEFLKSDIKPTIKYDVIWESVNYKANEKGVKNYVFAYCTNTWTKGEKSVQIVTFQVDAIKDGKIVEDRRNKKMKEKN